MEKEIVLLTKSKKYNGYCVTGIDVKSGEWLRLIQPGQLSVLPDDFRYSNGEEPKILDAIKVEVGERCGTSLQPENILFDVSSLVAIDKNDKVVEQRADKDYETHEWVFHNKYPKLLDSMLPSDALNNPYSLMIIQPEDVSVHKRSEEKLTMNFRWKGRQYKDFRITDTEFIGELADLVVGRTQEIEEPIYIVISLGESFINPGSGAKEYYKLVSAVIAKDRLDTNENDNEGKDKYEIAKNILEKIACGFDPYTGDYLENDSVWNKPDTIRSLFLAVRALDGYAQIENNVGKKKNRKKSPFEITDEQAKNIKFSEEPLPISKVVARINKVVDVSAVRKLGYKTVVQWLISQSYIVEKDIDGKTVKYPTEKGIQIGISIEKRITQIGRAYTVTLYDINAQKFIVNNINEIMSNQ